MAQQMTRRRSEMGFGAVWLRLGVGLVAALFLAQAQAFSSFRIDDIRLEGLRRISPGTVFNYLPLKAGDRFDQDSSRKAIQALFKTGLFSDIRLEQEGGVLIVRVVERPAIAQVSFEGNDNIEDEQLRDAMKIIGFAEGRVFDRSLLDKVELELQRQYYSQGRYAVRLTTTVTPLERNRVHVHIDISEGKIAKIRQINITGTQAFSSDDLVDEFELSPSTWYSFFSSSDQYSKQKLAGDLETLRAYYLDRGYINFNADSTQVAITPDKHDIYITVNLSEGKQYTVSKVKLLGNLIVPEEELLKRVSVKPGDIFSRKEVSASTEAMIERIGDEGYAFANVNAVPEFVPGTQEAVLNFYIDPGKRVYVRRLNFQGNTRTRDEVLRQEMRQMEGGWASTKDIKRSRTRLERLGYFEEVNVETEPVAGLTDQVDVNFTVVERPSGNLVAGVGYSQTQGFLFNASISQENFLGSGKQVGVSFNNSQSNTVYSFSYSDPYFTIDGVSQGFKVFYQTTDAGEANLSKYVTDSYGVTLDFGLPINEYDFVRLGFEPQHLTIKTTDTSPTEVHDYIGEHGDGYNIFKFTGAWSHDTRNRALFPDSGVLQYLGGEVAVPGSDLTYYKLRYRYRWYYPLTKSYTLSLKGEVAYGEGIGDTEYPFFENYTAGGPQSVRGFKENTLGPQDSNTNPYGGNLKTVANLELLMPMPFTKDSRSVRLAAFFDVGNVYGLEEDFDTSQLRYSTGVGLLWYSPLGGLSFSLAKPLNTQDGDNTQVFQFSLGTTF